MLGLPTVTATISTTGNNGELDSQLFDVSPTLQGARYLYLPTAAWSIFVAAVLMTTNSRLNLVLAAAIVMSSAAGMRGNLMAWRTAAHLRDDLLATVDRARQAGCTAVWVRSVPDAVDGAYVFRNGLADAIAPVVLTQSAPPSCTVAGP